MKSYELLERGLARIDSEGWAQGPDMRQQNCLWLAIDRESRKDAARWPARSRQTLVEAGLALHKAAGFSVGPWEVEILSCECARMTPILFTLFDWNDTPGRTLEEVRDVYLRAIRAEKERASSEEETETETETETEPTPRPTPTAMILA